MSESQDEPRPAPRPHCIRIEVEHSDGLIEYATGAEAEAIWQGYNHALFFWALHGQSYRGPKFLTRRRTSPEPTHEETAP